MFHSARIKLTVWYLIIIALISLAFSLAIYRVLASELDRVQRVERLRIERGLRSRPFLIPPLGNNTQITLILDQDLVTETKTRLGIILVVINTLILSASAIAGFFLASITLQPIKQMVDEQKRFVSDASHELRTPITSLKSEIEVNLRDKNLTLAQAKTLLKSNLEDVDSLQILSDSLIKLTQYQKGENNLEVTEFPLTLAIGEAVKRTSGLAKSKQITLTTSSAEIQIQAVRPALTELFAIFLDNAIKYSPNKTKVTISARQEAGNIHIIISDQGIGISEKDLPHLFDRFYRADKSRTKTDVSGYGLGLAIAKQIVERHSGTIKVESSVGYGTSFTINLPLKTTHWKNIS